MGIIVDIMSRLTGRDGGLRIEAANARFGVGDLVAVTSYHWETGAFETRASVVARVGSDRLVIRVAGATEALSVDARDCEIVEQAS